MTFLPTIYPASIARAISAIDEVAAFKDMPDGFIRVMVRIIKKIDLRNPTKAIVASRLTLAEEAGKSVETVHRCMRWLEEQGFIERSQKARSGLRGSSSPITPTPALLEALLLTADAKQRIEKARHVAPAQPSSKRKDFIRVQGMTLPKDLSWLALDGQMPATAVLKLMSMAREQKQRLTDVVEATKGYLIDLKGKALFCYLRKLIRKGQDFKQRAAETKEAQQEQQEVERVKRKSAELVGRSFKTPDASVLITVEEGGVLREEQGRKVTYCNMSTRFLDAIDAGRLLPART